MHFIDFKQFKHNEINMINEREDKMFSVQYKISNNNSPCIGTRKIIFLQSDQQKTIGFRTF